MSKGKRYDGEGKLNYKKVFATIIAIVVIIMCIIIVVNLAKKAKDTESNVPVNYYALYVDNKWGVVNTKNEIVIDPMYQEMIIVLDNSKDVFLCTYDVNEETGEYKTKVINSKNKEIYTEYNKVEVLENYDKAGNAWYEKEIFKVEKDGKYGLIDINGKQVLEMQYEDIDTLKGIENSLLVKKDGKYGLVNKSGVTVIEPKYTTIKALGEDYRYGYITIDENKKHGLVNYNGTQILENKYEEIEQISGEKYFVIKEDGKQKVINTDGKVIISEGYDKISQINTDGIIFIQDKKYGLMGLDGKVKIKAKYDDLKEINSGILKAKKDDKCGIIDLTEDEKVEFKYEDIYYEEKAGIYVAEDKDYTSTIMDLDFNAKLTGILSEFNVEQGYMKLRIDNQYKYYNFKFEEKDIKEVLTSNTIFVSEKDGKYGYVDKEGNVVVDYIYEEALEQNKYGYAAVKQNGLWGSIDGKGNTIVEPKYELKNNLVIDFIGKWHLGQDLNMNYYCEK